MIQIARNGTMADRGFLSPDQYLTCDRGGKYCPASQRIITNADVTRVPLPPRPPDLNGYAERRVRSVKSECFSQPMLFGARALWRALADYNIHYHEERPHQVKGNGVPMRSAQDLGRNGPIWCYERLGGLLK